MTFTTCGLDFNEKSPIFGRKLTSTYGWSKNSSVSDHFFSQNYFVRCPEQESAIILTVNNPICFSQSVLWLKAVLLPKTFYSFLRKRGEKKFHAEMNELNLWEIYRRTILLRIV